MSCLICTAAVPRAILNSYGAPYHLFSKCPLLLLSGGFCNNPINIRLLYIESCVIWLGRFMRQFYFLLPLKKYKYQAVSHNFLCNKLLIIQVQIHKVMQFNPGSFFKNCRAVISHKIQKASNCRTYEQSCTFRCFLQCGTSICLMCI